MTPAQIAAVAADILANGDLNSHPRTYAGAQAITALYNTATATDVWRTEAPVQGIYDAINWSAYTPNDAPDNTATYTNRVLNIQTKQMNLQNILQGRSTVDASKANLRAGLRDAVIALPAGAGGANVSAGGAGGATVLAACIRKATRIEKLFATQTATTGAVTANLLTFEGAITSDDVQQAMGI